MLLQMALFRVFYGWVTFRYMDVPRLLYPFLCQWMFTFVFQGTQELLLELRQRVDQCFSKLSLYRNPLESFLRQTSRLSPRAPHLRPL